MSKIVNVENEHFKAWTEYWGRLATVTDPCGASRIYGFENVSDKNRIHSPDYNIENYEFGKDSPAGGHIPDAGATYGFVIQGAASFISDNASWFLSEGQWFSFANGFNFVLDHDSRIVVLQKLDFLGLNTAGGPIEDKGRLKYIDKCSDTILVGPPYLGDPCFNHLHFPIGIDQTEHTHPSVRAGAIASGRGWCETPYGRSELEPGVIFTIPRDGKHRFITDETFMNVIAYHPDSDWGPTDEIHPMVNRTWVDGHKIDNTVGVHMEAEVIGR